MTLEDNKIDQALRACKRAFNYIVFFGFIVSFLTLATSIYSLEVFDRVLSSGSIETLIALTIIIVIFSIILHFVQAIRSIITSHISKYLDHKLSSLFIDLSLTSLKTDNSKSSVPQNIKDLSAIRNFITSPTLITTIDAPWSLLYILVIFLIHPLPGLIVAGGALVLLFLAWLNNALTKKETEKVNSMNMHSIKELEILNRNAEVIEAMAMKDTLISNWQEINQELVNLQNELSFKSNLITNFTKFFRAMIYIVLIAIGAVLTLTNKMSPGGIIAISILSGKALMPFDAAINIWNNLLNSKKSYDRLKTLTSENDQELDLISLPEPLGKLAIEGLAFNPPKAKKPIIKGINIDINPGEIVAIIGPTAAGKSTLAKLIAGIYKPTLGTVRLDNADILNFQPEEIGKYVGYLPQDVELFNGSIKQNIARMNKKAKDEDIVKAAQLAHTHNLILNLPKSYETDIGAWGSSISAGQRQRIGLARAFYGNPKLVILDEPNSNLDQDGEIALAMTLEKAKQQKITTIVISHRQNILQVVDKILVVHNGEAKMFGPRDEILKKFKEIGIDPTIKGDKK
jgi:PrtD family type I secretion system ABC transporter